MMNILGDALHLLRILTSFDNPMSLNPLETLKMESGLDDVRFEKAKEYLRAAKYIQTTQTAGGTTGNCWITPEGVAFLNSEMSKRIALSLTAEKIARFLFSKHPQYSATADQIKEAVGCDEDECQQTFIELIDEGLAEDYLKSQSTFRISMIRLTSVGRTAVRNNFIRQSGGVTVMEDNRIEVTLGDGNVFHNSNLVVAKKIEDSFNKAASAEVSDELKGLLKELAVAIGKMSEELSPEESEQVARDLETLTAEATSSKPRQKWWQLSVEGLEQAAKNVGKVGVPVAILAVKIAAILAGMPSG
jgi:hypothetical protein